MICKWSIGKNVFEFDATTKADEQAKVRAWAKEHGWKLKDMKREV